MAQKPMITSYKNIYLTSILSLIMGAFGYSIGGIFFAYLYWSWVWGLKLLYPGYLRRVKSHRFGWMRAYGYFFYGAFYICWALLVGAFGGGIYKVIIDWRALISKSTAQDFYAKTKDISKSEAPTKKCPNCAEEIKLDAKECRYCGRQFRDGEIAEAKREIEPLTKAEKEKVRKKAEEDEKRKTLKKATTLKVFGWILVCLGVFLPLVYVGGVISRPKPIATPWFIFGIVFWFLPLVLGLILLRKGGYVRQSINGHSKSPL